MVFSQPTVQQSRFDSGPKLQMANFKINLKISDFFQANFLTFQIQKFQRFFEDFFFFTFQTWKFPYIFEKISEIDLKISDLFFIPIFSSISTMAMISIVNFTCKQKLFS